MSDSPITVGIIGGGLAGMAAASVASERGLEVEMFEARAQIGGRATSLPSGDGQRRIDLCQHVTMGCCGELFQFLRRLHIADFFQPEDRLNFIDRQGECRTLRTANWLPAPLHAIPLVFGRSDLSLRDKISIARVLRRLRRLPNSPQTRAQTMGRWLASMGQTPEVVERFWAVILTSALGETVARASLAAARHVFVEGFMRSRAGARLYMPTAPLYHIFHEQTVEYYRHQGVVIHNSCPVESVTVEERQRPRIELPDGTCREFDYVVLAVPWNVAGSLLVVPEDSQAGLQQQFARIETVPITAIHLWFDQPITALRHAVLIGRLSQWLFNGGLRAGLRLDQPAHYYQVVISASRELIGRRPGPLVQQVLDELAAIWPKVRTSRVMESQVVTYRPAVFSVSPESEAARPAQQTRFPRLWLAGDWTRTGWPATMESAVRSGNLAANGILKAVVNQETT